MTSLFQADRLWASKIYQETALTELTNQTRTLGDFVAGLTFDALPAPVVAQAQV